ncbi:hypothetical protein ACEWY4_006859 [Coilia grayii]|uniref:Macrophage mannose receptor 1-like n=1 Tax=Coilia grayii TaxID=363190 RepID=A0ABD1KEX3_9TELE
MSSTRSRGAGDGMRRVKRPPRRKPKMSRLRPAMCCRAQLSVSRTQSGSTPGESQALPLEVALMQLVSHPPGCPYVLQLLDWFEESNKFILVLERPFPCMDLFEFQGEFGGRLDECLARIIFLQVVHAVLHCYERGVLHRDIKPENLLVQTDTLRVKLIDFGCGDLLRDDDYQDFAGTEEYCPPEWLVNGRYSGRPATIWSLGILLFSMISGDLPFNKESEIIAGQLKFKKGLSEAHVHIQTAYGQMPATMRTTIFRIALVILHVTLCSSQSEGNFLMYDKNVNKCLKGYQPLKLFYCDSNQLSQQFRWTSNDRIFNVNLKKCLGAGSKADGSGLQWYTCDDKSDLQKWECNNNTLLTLKGTDLFLSQEENTVLRLTQDNSTASQWLIHGTEEGLCSRPYQELYTIEGNAFGSPCHFPFQYEKNWYSDCKSEKSTERRWCSVDRDYKEKWGYCPTTSTEHWKKNPVTGIFYQVNVNSALTWHQARKSCQQQDSDLLSITEPQEQTFISGITSDFQTTLWIGLNQLNTESGWQWVDGYPFRYLRWGPGQPDPAPGWSCASLNTAQTSDHWENKLCNKKHGYICQKKNTTPVATTGPPVACKAPWIPYAGHCYFLNRTKNTWKEANDQCITGGGHLVSIHNIEEQSFVFSQLGYRETDKLWIGLNDKKTQLLFDWSDQSPVTFTTWDAQEPSHHRSEEEDCVLMGGKDGNWADASCEEQNGFICKIAGDSKSPQGHTDNDGCKAGWTRYGYNCYFVGSTTKTFDEAKQSCQDSGAHLVDVPHRVENAFLISLVGARPERHFWMGLTNQRDRYTFEWTNTPNVPYTHWNTLMPGQKQGCVAMTTGTLAGLWDVLSCSSKEKYICKHQAEGVVTTPAPPTSPAPSCAQGWNPLGTRPFCYKWFDMKAEEQRTWSEALQYCRSIGGDLLSIHSNLDFNQRSYHFRDDVPRHFYYYHYYTPRAWIGYSAQDPNVGYTWSDGSSSSFTNWDFGEPNNSNNRESCAEIKSNMKWNDVPCEKKMDFLCQIRKGLTPKNATVPQYNVTEDGWTEFGGHQYLMVEDNEQMDDARRVCKKGNGDLAVIDSKEEWTFVYGQAHRKSNRFYIGLKVDLDKNAEWVDKTPVVWTHWGKDEPSFDANDETCVVMESYYGFWYATNCGIRHEFICEREGPAINSTVAPTEAPTGGCAPDWTQYKQHCYQSHPEKRNWTDAKTFCNKVRGHLVSILSKDEQAFLTTMIGNDPQDMWIGLRSFNGKAWTEGKKLTYNNFMSNRYFGDRSCGAMTSKPRTQFGKWKPCECTLAMGFICKRPTDVNFAPQDKVPSESYVQFGNYSLKVLLNNLTWWEAKKACEEDKAHLASIRDGITQAFIQLQSHLLKQPIWIGLNKNLTHGDFTWIDKWHLNMENWLWRTRVNEQFPCVLVDSSGQWVTTPCNRSLPSVCKRSTDIPPTPSTKYPGLCSQSWLPFRSYCYKVSPNRADWNTAVVQCGKLGGSLLSIEDTEEADFLKTMGELVEDTYDELWLGLYKNLKGQWHWWDKTVVGYTNWAKDEPNDDNYFKHYAVISTSDLTWKAVSTYSSAAYICKKPKEPLPTESTTETPQVQRFQKVLIVPFIITLVIVIGFVFLVFFYNRNFKLSPPTLPAFENPLYFKSSKPDISEKNLVHNIEIDPCSS